MRARWLHCRRDDAPFVFPAGDRSVLLADGNPDALQTMAALLEMHGILAVG